MRLLGKKLNYEDPKPEPSDEMHFECIYLGGEAFDKFMGNHTAVDGDEIEATFKMKVKSFSASDKVIRLDIYGVTDGPYLVKARAKKASPLPSK